MLNAEHLRQDEIYELPRTSNQAALQMGLVGRTSYIPNEAYRSLWTAWKWHPSVDIGALFYIVLQMLGHKLHNMQPAEDAYRQGVMKNPTERLFRSSVREERNAIER